MEGVEGVLRKLSTEKEESLIRDWNSTNIMHSEMKSVEQKTGKFLRDDVGFIKRESLYGIKSGGISDGRDVEGECDGSG